MLRHAFLRAHSPLARCRSAASMSAVVCGGHAVKTDGSGHASASIAAVSVPRGLASAAARQPGFPTRAPLSLAQPRRHASAAAVAEKTADEGDAAVDALLDVPPAEWADGAAPFRPGERKRLAQLRNIGISAHIDSGKTTLTERVLYYTGKIGEMHEVRGKDNVGAKMDSMDLEREKGITIQSAATYTQWELMRARTNDAPTDPYTINIIDTPGHVDFTIEVERALRVLDGAVLVLCAVGGVQSQTITVDRQMKRYNVPRLCFINKLDRAGANPFRIIGQLRSKLGLNAAAVQIPIGIESSLEGVVDLVRMCAYYNEGAKGEVIRKAEVPANLVEEATSKRTDLVAALADVDDEMAEYFLEEKDPDNATLEAAIRRTTLARTFTPVFMGSAYHNRGVQPLLDGVCDYLPSPHEVCNRALDQARNERPVALTSAAESPLVALAFKLEEGRFGQLTYLRVYQGSIKRGQIIVNAKTGKKVKVPRLVRMHSNEMEDVDHVDAGEICALFGIECASGDTFTTGAGYTMTSMYVPPAVISLSITPTKDTPNFSKALQRFVKEDPTFRVHVDSESKQTIISGMGELHLDIYVERMRREYGVACTTGKPQVAFRETITRKAVFNFTHKKQTGGSGQYAKVVGYIEPIDTEAEGAETEGSSSRSNDAASGENIEFVNNTIGMNIPAQYIPAIEKGFREACEKGWLIGHPIRNVRFVLEDGLAHAVDSSELAFKLCAQYAFREAFLTAGAVVLEPVMDVTVTAPAEYQGTLVGLLNRRKGTIADSNVADGYVEVQAQVPLNDMFGYSTDLRSATQGKGEFAMEYARHNAVLPPTQEALIKEYQRKRAESSKK